MRVTLDDAKKSSHNITEYHKFKFYLGGREYLYMSLIDLLNLNKIGCNADFLFRLLETAKDNNENF